MARRKSIKLDRIDCKILQAVQTDCRMTSEKISQIAHLSKTAVQRRLVRLRDAGIIEREVAIIEPKSVGRMVTMIVHVALERERADIIDRCKQAIRNNPEVMCGYHVTGDTDFVMIVTARSMEEFELFTRRFLYELPSLKLYRTLVVMDRVKSGFAIPIEVQGDNLEEDS